MFGHTGNSLNGCDKDAEHPDCKVEAAEELCRSQAIRASNSAHFCRPAEPVEAAYADADVESSGHVVRTVES